MKEQKENITMSRRDQQFIPRPQTDVETQPFETVEDLWFWFIQAQTAKNEGARVSAGQGSVRRPCEPLDILKILDGLYRNRCIIREHLLVLRYYGRRMLAPDPRRIKEVRAYKLWNEALSHMQPALERKGIVKQNIFRLFPEMA
jgi:hypothetical protein